MIPFLRMNLIVIAKVEWLILMNISISTLISNSGKVRFTPSSLLVTIGNCNKRAVLVRVRQFFFLNQMLHKRINISLIIIIIKKKKKKNISLDRNNIQQSGSQKTEIPVSGNCDHRSVHSNSIMLSSPPRKSIKTPSCVLEWVSSSPIMHVPPPHPYHSSL